VKQSKSGTERKTEQIRNREKREERDREKFGLVVKSLKIYKEEDRTDGQI
jgi:hypothetical protein